MTEWLFIPILVLQDQITTLNHQCLIQTLMTTYKRVAISIIRPNTSDIILTIHPHGVLQDNRGRRRGTRYLQTP